MADVNSEQGKGSGMNSGDRERDIKLFLGTARECRAQAHGSAQAYWLNGAAEMLERAVEVIRAAQGTEAQRAETLGSVHDGPVPKGCAQTTPDNPVSGKRD